MEGDRDRKLPALKVFISQLNRAGQPAQAAGVVIGVEDSSSLVGLVLLGIEFTRVWIQVPLLLCIIRGMMQQ